MIRQATNTRAWSQQSGAALIVGLIMMLVLTVLGVSGMTVSIFGLTMASNAQFEQTTFQAAENGIDFTLDNFNENTVATQNFAPAYTDGTYTANTVLTCQTRTFYIHSSFTMGEDEASVDAIHFDVVSTSTGPDGANSLNTQSFYIAGASTGDPNC